jgi:cysteine desulfuration protein SufE
VTPAEKLRQLVDDLAVIDDPQERLAHVVARAKRLPPLPADARTDDHRVRGCVSVVWLAGEVADGRCVFRCAADSPIVQGLIVLLCEFFSGLTPAEAAACDLDPLESTGLLRNLSPTRRNGLASALNAIRAYARNHSG